MARTRSTHFVFQPVILVRPCEMVAYRITAAIRAGDVKVGERLPGEQGLSEQLRVSRPTLREAIKLLAEAGIVQVFPGSSGGTFVISAYIPLELCGFPSPDFDLQSNNVNSLLEARRLFEPHVVRLASMYATPADFERMRDAVKLSEETSAEFKKKEITEVDAKLMTIASTRFNIAVARATQNIMIVQTMEVMMQRLELVRSLALRELPDAGMSAQHLRDSLLAIESGNSDQIGAATLARIELLESAWEQASGRQLRRRGIMQTHTASAIMQKPAHKREQGLPRPSEKSKKSSKDGLKNPSTKVLPGH